MAESMITLHRTISNFDFDVYTQVIPRTLFEFGACLTFPESINQVIDTELTFAFTLLFTPICIVQICHPWRHSPSHYLYSHSRSHLHLVSCLTLNLTN
eukprot:42803_1